MSDRYAEKVSRNARRSAGNEAILLFWAVAIVMFLVSFYAIYNWIPFVIGLNAFGISAVVALIFGTLVANRYYYWASKKIRTAMVENNELMKAIKAERETETEKQIDVMLREASNVPRVPRK